DAYLARSFENKEHFFVHMMVMQRECALARRNHGYAISQLLGADFPANLCEHCTVEFRLYRFRHGSRKWSKLELRNVDDRSRHAWSPCCGISGCQVFGALSGSRPRRNQGCQDDADVSRSPTETKPKISWRPSSLTDRGWGAPIVDRLTQSV